MYAMVDCNSFYCSCERLFDPSLGNRPVIVLSNNDGCAVSRSEEAKAIGVSMGTPEFMIADLIAKYNIAVFSSNYTLYQDISERVMQTLGSFVPGIEVYSIDEAFLDMHHMPHHDLFVLAMNIKNTVFRNIGIPVSVGIAPTKTLAKMANRFAKRFHRDAGIFFAASKEMQREILERTEIGEVWGIGKKHAAFLKLYGFKTAADLAGAPDNWVQRNLSVTGLRLVNELRGIAAIEWQFVQSKNKNICTSRSVGTPTSDFNTIREAIANHACNCATKLREQQSAARAVHVFMQTNAHRTHDHQFARSVTITLPEASNDNPAIIKAAGKALSLIYHPRYLFKKLGVVVMDLVPQNERQRVMFDENRAGSKWSAVMQAVDSINKLQGRNTVCMAAQLGDKKWKLRANHLSRQYTTNIDHLPEINSP